MPFGDGTGPVSQGPMTGKGRGDCIVEYDQNMNFTNGRGSGRGLGFGQGMRRGVRCGVGFGFGRKGMGRGLGRWTDGATALNKDIKLQLEKENLLKEAQMLKAQMEQVINRLEQLTLVENNKEEE